MYQLIQGPDRGKFERVDLAGLLGGALDRVEEALGEDDPGWVLLLLADAWKAADVLRGTVAGLWCSDCGSPLQSNGEEACCCETCPDCEAERCVCRFYRGDVPARDAEKIDLAAVLSELRRLRDLLTV